MMKEFFMIPLKEMRRRSLRSWLTLIGIIIGITAIVSLITIGQGLENAIVQQFSSLGDDKLFITARGSRLSAGLSIDSIKITEDDLDVVKKNSGVEIATGMIYSTGKVEYNDVPRYFLVWGASSDPDERALIGEAQSFKIDEGRTLEKGDKYKAVVGNDYFSENLFDEKIEIGDKISIQDQNFKIAGSWQKIGTNQDDRSILIPIETYFELFGNEDEYGLIIAQVKDSAKINEISQDVKEDLLESRNKEEGKEDFNIETPQDYFNSFGVILDILQIVLIGIASISLLVGGIGIMNTMYTSVLQRTKDIGIMKAIGASNEQLLALFLFESGFYGFGGGLIGVIFGVIIAKSLEYFFKAFVGPNYLLISIDYKLIIGTLLFSFIVGCISGIAPALKATKLKPVESLRYE